MSKEKVTEFFCAVASDKDLQEKLAAATDQESFVKIAQQSGYSFTKEELNAVIAEQNEGELSDASLDAVAGGGSQALLPCVNCLCIF